MTRSALFAEQHGATRERGGIGGKRLDDFWSPRGGRDARDQAVGDPTDHFGRSERIQHPPDAREHPFRVGARRHRQTGDVELSLSDKELGFFDFLGLDDLTAGRYDAEGVLLGGKGGGSHHPPRQDQRISRLPCEWLCKAGGSYQN